MNSVRTLADDTSVSADGNFLEIGGNSIFAIRLG